jgi:hypothetical protein
MAKLTASARASIVDDIEQTAGTPEGSARKVAARHNVSPSTVRKIARESRDPEPAEEAATAEAVPEMTLAEARAALQRRWLATANQGLDWSTEAYTVYGFGGQDGDYSEHTLDRPPAADWGHYIKGAGLATDKMLALAKFDSGDTGVSEAVSVIGDIVHALRENVTSGAGEGD